MKTTGEYTVVGKPEWKLDFPPEFDPWTCYLFNAKPGNGLSWRPLKGTTPNFFVRWMMRVMLGCTWVRNP